MLMSRYEERSTIISSNRPVEDWAKLLGDDIVVTPPLDRLTHHAHLDNNGNRTSTRMCMKPAQISLVLQIALFIGGCGQPASDQEPAAPVVAEHMATGTLNSIDRAAGTVNVTHGPVRSAGWPEMTMSFKLAG